MTKKQEQSEEGWKEGSVKFDMNMTHMQGDKKQNSFLHGEQIKPTVTMIPLITKSFNTQ